MSQLIDHVTSRNIFDIAQLYVSLCSFSTKIRAIDTKLESEYQRDIMILFDQSSD
jgi:hypothetical protein